MAFLDETGLLNIWNNKLLPKFTAINNKLNGHTINSDVPEDAKFTDTNDNTTYSLSSSDSKVTLTGSDGTSSSVDIPTGDITAVDPGTTTDAVSVYYTKEEVNNLIPDVSIYQTADQVNSAITTKINSKITISAADPSGGSDGDIWFKYEE